MSARNATARETLARARDFGVPALDLGEFDLAASAAGVVDEALVGKHGVLPLVRRGRRLHVAMADPADTRALDEIKFQTGLDVEPVVVEPACAGGRHRAVARPRAGGPVGGPRGRQGTTFRPSNWSPWQRTGRRTSRRVRVRTMLRWSVSSTGSCWRRSGRARRTSTSNRTNGAAACGSARTASCARSAARRATSRRGWPRA